MFDNSYPIWWHHKVIIITMQHHAHFLASKANNLVITRSCSWLWLHKIFFFFYRIFSSFFFLWIFFHSASIKHVISLNPLPSTIFFLFSFFHIILARISKNRQLSSFSSRHCFWYSILCPMAANFRRTSVCHDSNVQPEPAIPFPMPSTLPTPHTKVENALKTGQKCHVSAWPFLASQVTKYISLLREIARGPTQKGKGRGRGAVLVRIASLGCGGATGRVK